MPPTRMQLGVRKVGRVGAAKTWEWTPENIKEAFALVKRWEADGHGAYEVVVREVVAWRVLQDESFED